MGNIMRKKAISTFDREMKNSKFKKIFEKRYLSPTTIQNIRSNKQKGIKMRNFIEFSRECGYQPVGVKGGGGSPHFFLC